MHLAATTTGLVYVGMALTRRLDALTAGQQLDAKGWAALDISDLTRSRRKSELATSRPAMVPLPQVHDYRVILLYPTGQSCGVRSDHLVLLEPSPRLRALGECRRSDRRPCGQVPERPSSA